MSPGGNWIPPVFVTCAGETYDKKKSFLFYRVEEKKLGKEYQSGIEYQLVEKYQLK